jgi:menaquinone-dependent protoporphyrinogen IX oxidase
VKMKILVGYATGYGSTKSYADVIAEELTRAGHETDAFPAKGVKNLAAYDFVVVGGSIRAGRWLGPAVKLARATVKAGTRHALFFCCLSARTEEGKRRVFGDYLEKVKGKVPGLAPLDVGAFPGMSNYDQWGFVLKKIMAGVAEKGGETLNRTMDYREPEAAREWARELARKLG